MNATPLLMLLLGLAFGLAVGTVGTYVVERERRRALQALLERAERDGAAARDSFAALSREALERNTASFLDLADQRLRQATTAASGDLAARQQAIDAMVAPLRESLSRVQQQVEQVERTRIGSSAALIEQVAAVERSSDALRRETAALVTALRAPQVRGRWGEHQLRRIVEVAGMVEHCDFDEQPTSAGDEGALRPDLVVRLAGGKQVVVDAKVPFAGYLEAVEARDDATRQARLAAHARHLREHIDRLAAKAYWERFDPSPEFVVLFVPADAFLHAALEQEPALLEHAFARNVVVATPSTLVALLRTVAYAWRQESLAANAQEVYALGRELHGRLATMGGHIARLGAQLNATVTHYNKAVSSLEGRVLVTARRFSDLKVTDHDLEPPQQLEVVARQPQSPELVASASDALVSLTDRPADARTESASVG